jgi:hypothetical protein
LAQRVSGGKSSDPSGTDPPSTVILSQQATGRKYIGALGLITPKSVENSAFDFKNAAASLTTMAFAVPQTSQAETFTTQFPYGSD